MTGLRKSDFMELSEISDLVTQCSLGFEIRSFNLQATQNLHKKAIRITRDKQNKLHMHVVSQNKFSEINTAYKTITFEDHECEAMSYFLKQWDYAICLLYTEFKTTVIEVYANPCCN